MPVNATVTGKTGPGNTLTTAVFNNKQGILFLPDKKVIQILEYGDNQTPPALTIDVSAQTTITMTVSGTTLTVSYT